VHGAGWSAPAIGGAIAGALQPAPCTSSTCPTTRNNADSLPGLGIAAAMVIDWVFLAKHEVGTAPAVPYVTANAGGGLTLGLGGRF
jgi:hypothetical protein